MATARRTKKTLKATPIWVLLFGAFGAWVLVSAVIRGMKSKTSEQSSFDSVAMEVKKVVTPINA